MISIISRTYTNSDEVKLSARIKNKQVNSATALGITISKAKWTEVSSIIKSATISYRRNSCIYIDDNLANDLWTLKKTLMIKEEAGTLTPNRANECILEVLKRNVVEEIKSEDKNIILHTTFNMWITQFIDECDTGKRLKQKSAKRIAPSTVKGYRGFQAQLKEYQRKRHKIIDFDDVTLDFLEDFKKFFLEKNYSPNTIARHIRIMKIMLYAAKDMKLTTKDDFESPRFSATWEDVDNVYLTDERIEEIYVIDFDDKCKMENYINRADNEKERRKLRDMLRSKTSRRALDLYRDIFVVGCLTGQRVSDYKRINADMIVRLRDGGEYIHLFQDKTGNEVFIPLDMRVKAILNKRGGALPKIYDQHLNDHIKEIGELLGWTENAGLNERKGGMEYRSDKKFYECIKTHTARRSFATNAYKRNIPLSAIMAITGHSSEMMLKKYLKLDNKEKAMLAAREFSKAL